MVAFLVADDERIRSERFVVQSAAEIEIIHIGPASEVKDDKTEGRPIPDAP